MATNDNTALVHDLGDAIDELQSALQRASDAATRIRGLAPRIGAVGTLLDEIESVIRTGRQELGATTSVPESFARPTLVVPDEQLPTFEAPSPTPIFSEPDPEPIDEPQPAQTADELICFRLEFQSSGGPLDLRAVDDAVGEHPAVRDVALIDYDGRRATLKVWITGAATPAQVQQSLSERASQLFTDGSEVTIVALEDAA